jgi:excisionase family DNA binding protein
MSASNSQQNESQVLLTVEDVMQILSVSKKSVYRLVEHREIRHHKIRSGLRFRYVDLQEYLDRCCVEAINDEYVYGEKEKR